MRVAVMGSGGTGGFFGGLLARAGEDVVFIARGAHLETIRAQGLRVRSRLAGDFTVAAQATDDPRDIGRADLILFCVKAYDTAEAIERIRPLVGPATMILSVQNGVDSAEHIAKALGSAHVLGGVAQVTSVIEAPGVVVQGGGPGKIIFGEFGGEATPRVTRLLETFTRAGIAAEIHPDVRAALWEKFVFICGLSGLTALTRLPIGPLLAEPETRRLLRETMVEVDAVARAERVPIGRECVDQAMGLLARLEPWARGSLAHDLTAGRRLEIETLNGTVVRLGRTHGTPTPLNFAIYAALKPYADGPPPPP